MPLSMEKWKGKVAIVTGASAGIGAAIVEQLSEAGVTVVGIARRKHVVEELANKLINNSGKIHAIKADVSNEEDILQAFKWVKANLGPVHILINNAGFARANDLINGDTQKWKEVLDTNVVGLCICTREAVKDMRANNVAGHIIHMNSTTGHYIPNVLDLNVYPASKYAVTALTETLRQELNSINSKIKITSISPGNTKTDFVDASGFDTGKSIGQYLSSAPWLKAEDVADAVMYVLSTPPHVQIHELTLRSNSNPV